jgi:hypothetical protein
MECGCDRSKTKEMPVMNKSIVSATRESVQNQLPKTSKVEVALERTKRDDFLGFCVTCVYCDVMCV